MTLSAFDRMAAERKAAQRLSEHFTRPTPKPAGFVGVFWASRGRLGILAGGQFYAARSWPDFGAILAADIGKRVYRVGVGAAASFQVENEKQLRERLAKHNRTPDCFDAIRRDLDSAAMMNPALIYPDATEEESI